MHVELSKQEIDVIRRALSFAIDMGEDCYFAFYPDEDQSDAGYNNGDERKDKAARNMAQRLLDSRKLQIPTRKEKRKP